MLKHSVSPFRQLMVKGILSGAVMQTVSKEMFTGRSGREMVNKSLAQVDNNPQPPVQPACICFKSSRLWASRSRTRFCSARASAE